MMVMIFVLENRNLDYAALHQGYAGFMGLFISALNVVCMTLERYCARRIFRDMGQNVNKIF